MRKLESLRVVALATWVCGAWSLGCGSSSGGATPDAGTDSGSNPDVGSPDTGGKKDSGPPKDSGIPDSKGPTCPTPNDAGPPDKTPITGLTADSWSWVPVPGALCRDGSATGIGVSMGSSPNLMIFLEGGGACFNIPTCGENPSSFNEADFTMLTGKSSTWMGYSANVGILDRTNPENPVKDWSFVYVPYCTGDIHGGNNEANIPGIDAGEACGQKFFGYANMGLYLDRIVPTFTSVKQVLLAGMSGGGFGAAVNFPRVATAFGTIPVSMLDDSGPFMEDPYLATCLQNDVRTLWGLDKTILPECGSDCTNASSYFLDFVQQYVKANPKVTFGLADSTGDTTITQFFGFSADDCKSFMQESASQFTAGLEDIRSKLSAEKNYGGFIFTGTDHTTIQSSDFYTRTAGGGDSGKPVKMTEWVQALINGKATNAGP